MNRRKTMLAMLLGTACSTPQLTLPGAPQEAPKPTDGGDETVTESQEPSRVSAPTPQPEPSWNLVSLIDASVLWTGSGSGPYQFDGQTEDSTVHIRIHDDWYLATGDPTHACDLTFTVVRASEPGSGHHDLLLALALETGEVTSTCDAGFDDGQYGISGLGLSSFVGTDAARGGVVLPVSDSLAMAFWLELGGEWYPVGYTITLETSATGALITDVAGVPIAAEMQPGRVRTGLYRAASLQVIRLSE